MRFSRTHRLPGPAARRPRPVVSLLLGAGVAVLVAFTATIALTATATLTATTALAAATASTGPSATDPSPGTDPSAGTGVPTVRPAPAYLVTLDRTGGFAGLDEQYLVDTRNPAPERYELFRLAGSPEFRALRSEYLPARTCCDFFSYVVKVSYRDGTTKSVSTMDTATAPEVLWQVVRLTQRIGLLSR